MAEAQPTYVPANTTGSITIVVLSWVLPAVATIAVVLRIISRRLQRLTIKTDDIIIMVALFPLWAHSAIILVTVYLGGVGHSITTLQPGNSIALFKGLTALQYSFGITLGLIKASIIFLLIHIFRTPTFKLLARIVLVYIICWALMCIFIGSLLCRPFAKNWDPTLPGECGSLFKAHTCIAALDILGNLLIIALPLKWIWQLNQDKVTRIFLSGIFALGFLDVAVGILRVVYLTELLTVNDIQGNAVNTWIWSVAEPSIAVVVACGPTYKPLLRIFRGRSPTAKSQYYRQKDHSGHSQSNGFSQKSQRSVDNERDAYKLDHMGAGIRADNHTSIRAMPQGHSALATDGRPFLYQGTPPNHFDLSHQDPRCQCQPNHSGINMSQEVRVDYARA